MAEAMIAEIVKNRRETVRVSLSEYEGHDLANLRVWFRAEDDQMRPGKAGLALRIDRVPALIEGLQALMIEAGKRGLVEG
ncbi:transcriptional coactivator p15/PC4 family protein [Zavarzinia aquatilis]|uniref:Transcriptional coactivator p15 (PC4) C-terminal domain-containing protein n=1 Tax=Zavarzinia aquatilis TaxID=2211142 RepID=A0A317ED59_9PROT|nr:transcriptional coactivator p15/PC4 family protein [Zavarzinia aquatilis]PWR24214.1 hypothetical protein DKG74_08835 [Zavarzinia aquatilis]